MRTFVERQVDELVEALPELLKAMAALLVGCAAILVIDLVYGLLAYFVGMWVAAVIGLICLIRPEVRPFGKGLLAAASVMLSALPVFLFGAVLRSMG